MDDRFEPGGTELPVVVDHKTGLMWQRKPAIEYMDWYDALSHARQLSLRFHGDWRLPTIRELVSIVDYERCFPAINREAFEVSPGPRFDMYWSSTSHARSSARAWYVNFENGHVCIANKAFDFYVRCVRGGK